MTEIDSATQSQVLAEAAVWEVAVVTWVAKWESKTELLFSCSLLYALFKTPITSQERDRDRQRHAVPGVGGGGGMGGGGRDMGGEMGV